MNNNIFEKLLIEKIENFRRAFNYTAEDVFFDENGKLIHPGEFGHYREETCKQFIRYITPSRLSIGQGFLINTYNEVSHQCDIVIYDALQTPLVESQFSQMFYTIESVAAVGEIKSVLSKQAFKETINKLATVKNMRERVKNPVVLKRERGRDFDPSSYAYDQLFTFIICKKLDFDITDISTNINSFYDEGLDYRYRHNLILSVEDGLLAYYDDNKKTMMYPSVNNVNLKNRFVCPNENPDAHFKFFASYLFMGTSNATILYPEISDYMGSTSCAIKWDEI